MEFTNIEINGKIATLTLSNPGKLNALSKRLMDEMVQGLRKCAEKKTLVVLLKAKANNHNVWSAGHDINELPEGGRDPLDYFDA